MSDKKISQLNELLTADIGDLIPIVDVSTNETKFIQKQNLTEIPSQTVNNGVTTKSPSEDAVFDAILAKGIVKSNAWKNNGAGTFTLEPDKYNIVVWSNTNIEILLPAVEVEKTIIVQGTTQNGLGAINFTINNIKVGGADLGTPYSVTVTDEKEVLIFYGNYYGWHLIGHANKAIDISTKLDLDGGNANQDIDIDGFGVNAKHFKVNGTAGAGHIGLKHQSANISASASESSIGADSVGDPVWKNDGGAIDKLELQSNKTSTVTGNEASVSKYLTVKGVYDWAVGLFAPKASPTFTGTITTPDIVVSGATINTIAHFDGTKNIESLPLATYPSLTEISYVKGVTSALQTQINAKLSGSGLTTDRLPKYNGTALVNSALSETATDINATLPINDSSATVASASIVDLPQIYNIITGTVNITEIRGAGGITVQNGSIRVLRFSGILNIGGGNPANRVDNGAYGIIATRAGDTAVYRKETNDWVLQSYKRSDGSPLTLGAYLNLTDSSATVTNVNPIQPVQLGLNQTPDSNRGFLMFQNGQANQLLRPYEGEFWANTGDGGYLSLWDGRRIASPANGGNASVYTSIARHANNNNGQKIEVNIFSVNNDPYYHINAILTVDFSGNVSNINIKQPSVNPTAFNITINAGKAQIVGNNYTLAFTATYRRLTYGGIGNARVLGIESEKYSTTGLAKYWTGSEGLGIGHASQVSSAILQADSTTKGSLPAPRMTNVQRTNIVSPAIGLMVYCTDTIEGLYIYKSTGWTFII